MSRNNCSAALRFSKIKRFHLLSNCICLARGRNLIIYNDNVIFAVAIGAATGFGMYSYSRNASVAELVGGLSVIVFDLFLRLRNQDQDAPLLAPDAGGHIWFCPVWIIGIVLTGIGGMMWLGWL